MRGTGERETSRTAERLPGALVSAAAFLGLLVGTRSVLAWELPRPTGLLRLPEIPREELALTWSASVRWPAEMQAAGLERIALLVGGLLLAAASVALVGSILLLFEAGASRRRDVALRAALGASPAEQILHLVRRIRTLGLAACSLGLMLGMTLMGALRTLWPGPLAPLETGDSVAAVLPVVTAAVVALALVYLRTGISIARGAPLAPTLLDGERSTAGRGDAARRRVIPALQTGMAGSVVIGASALVVPLLSTGVVAAAPDGRTAVIEVALRGTVAGGRWADTLARIVALPGVEAGSASTPGAEVGLGPRAPALAECGNCIRGLMVAPFWSALADHHAVSPGYLAEAGLEVSEGRDLAPTDGPDAPRVALVNRTFANTAFERGRPIGKRVRLGPGLDDWYTIVGVVEDFRTAAVGGDDLDRAAVYVSVLQRPPRVGRVLVTGTDEGILAARDVLAARGFEPSDPVPLSEVRRQAAAPLVWLARVAAFLCLAALLLAVLGARVTALHIARRRTRELAVRRALGADDRRVLAHVLGGAARSAGWGSALAIFGGSLLVAFLRKAMGGVPAPGPGIYLGVTGLLIAVSLLAALRAGRESLAVEPAAAMD